MIDPNKTTLVIPGWQEGRWWRVTAPDGSLWAETSDVNEARESMRPGDKLERLWIAELSEWREPHAEVVA